MFSVWALAPAFFDKTVNEDFPVVAGPAPTSGASPRDDGDDGLDGRERIGHGDERPGWRADDGRTHDGGRTHEWPPRPSRSAYAAGTFSGLPGTRRHGRRRALPPARRLEPRAPRNLDLQNGPDLVVYLVPRPGQTELDGAVSLGDLKGNKGNQNYPVPADVDPTQFGGVLVWCRAFSVEFAGAPFTGA